MSIHWVPRFSAFAAVLLTGLALAADSKVPTSLVSGMKITTANVVATVEVRAKSLGPGACGVNFSTDSGNSTSILAPPFTWSGWQTLASHIGTVTYKVEYEITCDTGAVAEVRYYR